MHSIAHFKFTHPHELHHPSHKKYDADKDFKFTHPHELHQQICTISLMHLHENLYNSHKKYDCPNTNSVATIMFKAYFLGANLPVILCSLGIRTTGQGLTSRPTYSFPDSDWGHTAYSSQQVLHLYLRLRYFPFKLQEVRPPL